MRRLSVFIAAALLTALQVAAAEDGGPPPRIRTSVSPERVRVVVDLPRAVTYSDTSTPSHAVLTLDLPLPKDIPPVTIADPIVTGATLTRNAAGHAVLTITQTAARKRAVQTLAPADTYPNRLVVDVLKRFRTTESREIVPGLTYTHIEEQTDTSYQQEHILDLDPAQSGLHLRTVAAGAYGDTVAAMTTRAGALAGLNGGFFITWPQRPVGLLTVAGKVLALPNWGRTAIAFPAKGLPVYGNPHGKWRVRLASGVTRDLPDWMDADGMDGCPSAAVLCGTALFAVPPNPIGDTYIIRNGVVTARERPFTHLPLDEDEFAIHLRPGADAAALTPGLTIGAKVSITPVLDPPWDKYPYALGAGPRLLQGGTVHITGVEERFQDDVRTGVRGHSAVATTKGGHVLLVAVEEPCAYGGGMGPEAFAAFLQGLGAVDAINLDSGGSTEMAIGSTTVTDRTGGDLRPIADAIVIVKDP